MWPWRDPAGPGHPTQDAANADRPVSSTTAAAQSPARGGTPPGATASVDAGPPTPDPLLALATADAANRTGAGQDEVRIVRVERRDWPDRSLGCPRPGLGYAQAITPGFIIVAEAGDQRLEYHTDHAQVVLCSSQLAPA